MSTCSNTSSHGTPSSCSITPTTCSSVSGGTLSRSVASSSMNSGGRRSGRVDRICPSLQNVGPSSSSAARTRLACRWRPTAPSESGRPNSSFSPCLAKTRRDLRAAGHQARLGVGLDDARPDHGRGSGDRARPAAAAIGRVHDDHGAPCVVADPVRHVARAGTPSAPPSRRSPRPARPPRGPRPRGRSPSPGRRRSTTCERPRAPASEVA